MNAIKLLESHHKKAKSALKKLSHGYDATTLDTTGMGIDEVVAELLNMLNSKVSS